MITATLSPSMQLDWLLPEYDAKLIEHRVIDGDPEAVYHAAATVDLAEVAQRSTAVRGLFAMRAAAERVISALTSRPAPVPAPVEPIRLGDLPDRGEWVRLGDEPPHELAFGVIGRFWGGETAWETIDAADFVAFDRPGFAKIACSVTLRPYGSARTLASYETRTQALDPGSRASFLRYWRIVWPGVAIVMRAYLRAVAEEVRP